MKIKKLINRLFKITHNFIYVILAIAAAYATLYNFDIRLIIGVGLFALINIGNEIRTNTKSVNVEKAYEVLKQFKDLEATNNINYGLIKHKLKGLEDIAFNNYLSEDEMVKVKDLIHKNYK